jgi:predicted DNA-binding protein (UPF0251 family)
MSTVDRFMSFVAPEPNCGCWLWMGSAQLVRRSYYRARFAYGGRAGGMKTAPRVSYLLFRGPIPSGLHVLHKCDVGLCVNPDHLYLGTHQDNMRDMKARGRYFAAIQPQACQRALEKAWANPPRPPRGEENPRAKLTASTVEEIRGLRGTGLRQADIAERYGVDQTQISRIFRGASWR